jgi:hypothetical protein
VHVLTKSTATSQSEISITLTCAAIITVSEVLQATKTSQVVAFYAIRKDIATSLTGSLSNGICWGGTSAVGRAELVVIVTAETRRQVAEQTPISE